MRKKKEREKEKEGERRRKEKDQLSDWQNGGVGQSERGERETGLIRHWSAVGKTLRRPSHKPPKRSPSPLSDRELEASGTSATIREQGLNL